MIAKYNVDQVAYNGFKKAIGSELANTAKTILRGCSVHWKTLVNHVNKLLAKIKDKFDIFKTLAYQVCELEDQADVFFCY